MGDVFYDLIIQKDLSKITSIKNGTSYLPPTKLDFGGSGNIAVGLNRLGGSAKFIGKAGTDFLGELYQTNLTEEGVNAKMFFDPIHPTGVTLSFVDSSGERSFLVSRGANDFLLPKEINQCGNEIKKSKYVFISGYSLVNCPQRDAIIKAVEIAKTSDTKIVFDPSTYNLIGHERAVFESFVDLCDVITLNLAEAQAFTTHNVIEDIARYLSKRVSLIALRMGEEGCLIITPDKKFKCPSNKVTCVDSTGAGDAFDSALIYGLIKELPIEKIGKLANWYASFNVKSMGARIFPTNDEIKNYFSTL